MRAAKRIVVSYPPEFDGELWIDYLEVEKRSFIFNFTHSQTGSAWQTLVSAAKAILAQDERNSLT